MGIGKLNMDRSHMDMPAKQAAAAVGQCELMHTYDTLFLKYSHTVGQILITGEDIENPERRTNFENTMKTLLKFGALPVVNENDTVATTEINSVGDNDTLGAIIAKTIDADILILMSDIDGLFTADPNRNPDARLIETVDEITKEIEAFAGDACSDLGTGGMATKIGAAQMVTESGCDMVIINGNYPDKLYDIVEGKSAGTLFRARR